MSDGVSIFPGVSTPLPGQILLWVLRSANMQLTTDQPFSRAFSGVKWDPQSGSSLANCVSGSFLTACVGGVYTGAGKTGTQIVASSQSWAGLTGVNAQVHFAIVANNLTFTSGPPILSLTTGNAAALLADIFLYGGNPD